MSIKYGPQNVRFVADVCCRAQISTGPLGPSLGNVPNKTFYILRLSEIYGWKLDIPASRASIEHSVYIVLVLLNHRCSKRKAFEDGSSGKVVAPQTYDSYVEEAAGNDAKKFSQRMQTILSALSD
jgi:hypothetical protein